MCCPNTLASFRKRRFPLSLPSIPSITNLLIVHPFIDRHCTRTTQDKVRGERNAEPRCGEYGAAQGGNARSPDWPVRSMASTLSSMLR